VRDRHEGQRLGARHPPSCLRTPVELSKSSLCNMLLADGEEDLAVLLARSELPELLDSERDAPALAVIGLDHDDLVAMLPAVTGNGRPSSSGEDAALRRTISNRWAELVNQWVDRPQPPS
jgi:hypothetical protein